MKRVFVICATVFMAGVLLAGDPPGPPANPGPVLAPPAVPFKFPVKRATQPLTRAALQRSPLSPWLRELLLAEVEQRASLQAATPTPGVDAIEPYDREMLISPFTLGLRRFRIAFDLTGTGATPTAVSNDSSTDQEPVIASNYFCNGFGCTERTYAAYMKRVLASGPNLYAWSRASGATTSLPFLKDPGGFDMNIGGDPAIATDSWTVGYIVGTAYNGPWTTIAVWRTLDAGLTWSQPTALSCANCPYARAGNSFLFDKPAVAVSYHSSPAPSTYGYVYVVTPLLDGFGVTTSTFSIARSTDSGVTFPVIASIPGDTPYTAPSQIMVDNATGYVYVFFLTWNTNALTVWRSTTQGSSWSKLTSLTLATPELLGAGGDSLCDQGGTGVRCLSARSMLVAKFNPTSRSVGLAYHGRASGSDRRAKVYFSALSLGDSLNGYTPSWITTNNSFAGAEAGSQWAPAIDYDNSGNFLLSYYDRRATPPPGQPADTLYQVYISKVTTSGTRVYADAAVTSTFADPRESANTMWILGEYKGLWTFSGNVYDAYTFVPSGASQEDIFYTPMWLP